MDNRKRNFCVTHNNYTEQTIEDYVGLDGLKYIVIGREIAPSTGTPHLQITLCWTHAKTLTATKSKLPAGNPHIEICQDVFASIEYCKKEGDFIESGVMPVDQRTKGEKEQERWDNILRNAQLGELDQIPSKVRLTMCRNIDFVRQKYLRAQGLEDSVYTHIWMYGPSRTGKSFKARQLAKEYGFSLYLKQCNKWWDGYNNEDMVLIEDFGTGEAIDGHACLLHHIKIWADRYPFPVEVKGGGYAIRPKLLVITSNYHPFQIWPRSSEYDPISQRFNIWEFKIPTSPGELNFTITPKAEATFYPVVNPDAMSQGEDMIWENPVMTPPQSQAEEEEYFLN